MSWHHPDLYFFLSLLAGLAAFLAIIYECIQKICRRKPPILDPSGSTPPRRDLPAPNPIRPGPGQETRLRDLQRRFRAARQADKQATGQFSRLCESVKDLPPKAQASRVHEHFGIFGGVRLAERRGRKRK